MMKIRTHIGEFQKANGDMRAMKFVRMEDLPQEFLNNRLRGGKEKKLSEGREVVWDLDVKDFRVFNWNTVQGEVSQIENYPIDWLD